MRVICLLSPLIYREMDVSPFITNRTLMLADGYYSCPNYEKKGGGDVGKIETP